MRRAIVSILGIVGLATLTGCVVYDDPYPRRVVYYSDPYYSPEVVVIGGGYHRGYYHHWR